MAGCEGLRAMVCPKPRRLGLQNPSDDSLIKHHLTYPINRLLQAEHCSGTEFLDAILAKQQGMSGGDVACSPPYFSGSPPSRAANPVSQDEQFFTGAKPGFVRIEGFQRDHRAVSARA